MTPRKPGTVLTLAALANFLDSILSPIASIAFGFGPMKTMPSCFQRRAEGGALGQESVAGMDGFGAGRLAGRDDLFGDEIALRGRRRADMHRLVGHLDMHGVAVGVGIDGDRRDPHLPRRLDDAAGDLAAIGDQDFLEHAARFLLAEAILYGLLGTASTASVGRTVRNARRRGTARRECRRR